MTSTTANLGLPYLADGQAQKHVTVNQTLQRLDAILQLTAESASVAAQPASPADGNVYILPTGKTGADWAGIADGAIACFRDGAWEEISPHEGWRAYVCDIAAPLVFNGTDWASDLNIAGSVTAATGFNMGGGRLRLFSDEIADDSATTSEANASSAGFAFLIVTAVASGAIMMFDTTGSYEISGVLQKEDYTPINYLTGALTGTTGADYRITVSIHTDNRIYLENRTGDVLRYRFFILDA